jgi:two-component system, chemotaxis family, sensor kinase CheA
MQIDVSRFRDAFYIEAAEHLQLMEAALLQLESAPQDVELLNTVFRAAHSIKGGSTTFGIDEVGRFTHVLENLLEKLRDGALQANNELVELLLVSVDVIDGLVSNARDGAPVPTNLEEVLNQLKMVNGQSVASEVATEEPKLPSPVDQEIAYRVQIFPSREFFRFGQDPLLLLREISDLGTTTKVTVDPSALPGLADLHAEECYLTWNIELKTVRPVNDLHDVFMFLDGGSKYQIEPMQKSEQDKGVEQPILTNSSELKTDVEPSSEVSTVVERRVEGDRRATNANVRSSENETVRVDRQRLDELINQIGELVIGASMVEQELLSIEGVSGLESLSGLGKIVRDLQEMSLALRMVPIAATFQKMNRVIRDVAKKVGKQINFVTEGDDTELDKSVVDQISDPLIHMVRNAADHGIETPEERLAAGKPAEGTVKLRAFQQGGNIYIELNDDGKGLDRQRILEKAIERNLVPADANLSDSEICNLIFLPGFSTAKVVTDVSGRGVGMDVVRRNVEALQGSVSVKSTQGLGSAITVRLPLTLAILDGLLVRLTNEVFVIPLLSVIESISIKSSDVRKIVGVGEVIQLRGEVLPMFRLHRLLGIAHTENIDDQVLLVIVEDQGRRLALRVDELLGQQQVVIKNLETNFHKVPGVAGATILGDGRVALILDVFGVSNLNNGRMSEVTSEAVAPRGEVQHSNN